MLLRLLVPFKSVYLCTSDLVIVPSASASRRPASYFFPSLFASQWSCLTRPPCLDCLNFVLCRRAASIDQKPASVTSTFSLPLLYHL